MVNRVLSLQYDFITSEGSAPVHKADLQGPISVLDQDTGLKPALTAWKAVVLITDTNPGYLK